jgi:hypothetical protein
MTARKIPTRLSLCHTAHVRMARMALKTGKHYVWSGLEKKIITFSEVHSNKQEPCEDQEGTEQLVDPTYRSLQSVSWHRSLLYDP